MTQPHEVILCNFGGPTSESEVEPFLRRLFEDPFIIRAPIGPTLRRLLARRIATKRAPKAAHEYAKIGFSPINRMTDAQGRELERLLKAIRPNTTVHVVNRYTAPFAADVVKKLVVPQSRLFILSLYPHICHSTTVSSYRDFDLAFEAHFGHRDVPSTRVFSWWHNRRYLDYAAGKLKEGLARALPLTPGAPVRVVFSAHGVPLRYQNRGDPYVNEIAAHFAELKARGEASLGADASRVSWHLSFQSRVGPVEWVKPYTEETIRELAAGGGTLLLVPISFTADHIETLFEMDVTYQELGRAHGFKAYARVEPGNDDPALAACLADVLVQHGF